MHKLGLYLGNGRSEEYLPQEDLLLLSCALHPSLGGGGEGGRMCSLNCPFINSSQEATEDMKKLRLKWLVIFPRQAGGREKLQTWLV